VPHVGEHNYDAPGDYNQPQPIKPLVAVFYGCLDLVKFVTNFVKVRHRGGVLHAADSITAADPESPEAVKAATKRARPGKKRGK